MHDIVGEVARFRAWEATGIPPVWEWETCVWEWEYPEWYPFLAASMHFIETRSFEDWTPDELDAVLYALARDHEGEVLAEECAARGAGCLIHLTKAAIAKGETGAKWQLASRLGRLDEHQDRAEQLLLVLATDEEEYVRRRSIMSLARLGSAATERLALDAWRRPAEDQHHARIAALWCLRRIGSEQLSRLLEEAEHGDQVHLRDYARRFRSGEVIFHDDE